MHAARTDHVLHVSVQRGQGVVPLLHLPPQFLLWLKQYRAQQLLGQAALCLAQGWGCNNNNDNNDGDVDDIKCEEDDNNKAIITILCSSCSDSQQLLIQTWLRVTDIIKWQQ